MLIGPKVWHSLTSILQLCNNDDILRPFYNLIYSVTLRLLYEELCYDETTTNIFHHTIYDVITMKCTLRRAFYNDLLFVLTTIYVSVMCLFSCSITIWLNTNMLGTEPQRQLKNWIRLILIRMVPNLNVTPNTRAKLIPYIMGNALEIIRKPYPIWFDIILCLDFSLYIGNSWHFIALPLTLEFYRSNNHICNGNNFWLLCRKIHLNLVQVYLCKIDHNLEI